MKPIAAAVVLGALAAAPAFVPARRIDGQLPLVPPATTLGWIEETADLIVDAGGAVASVTMLRANAPPANVLQSIVGTWRFQPATEDERPASSHVLAVAMIRPAQLYDQPSIGSPPADVARAPDDVPFPTVVRRPRYPPLAVGDAVVLVEALVDVDGRVRTATTVQGPRGFSEEAELTARAWVFRPAKRGSETSRAYVYLLFGFRQPVVAGNAQP